MNILIVDDNKNNRLILKLLLEDYMDENENVTLLIDEAEDGLKAVEKCKKNSFDIVFMDIMMPNMDGIEATKLIRKNDSKIMIIAVSAVDDTERKKMILNSGAEDYISKPINADIFVSRITNYISLIEARKTKKAYSDTVVNIYTKSVFKRHTRFLITNEDGLSEFWEYYLLSSATKCDNLSDTIRTIVSIAEVQLRLNIKSDIFVEESENKMYFTLTHIEDVPRKIIDLTLKKNNFEGSYKIDDTKISFEQNMDTEESQEVKIVEPEPVVAPIVETIEKVEEEVVASTIDISSSKELVVFDYMDEDDLYDLEEYASKLSSIMLIVGGGDITEEEVVEIYTYLDKIGSILSTYSEVYSISKALNELSIDMSSHIQEFMNNAQALGPMCKAFSNDMSSWIEQSFHTGAPSADFMNDTIVVNSQTIAGMLKMDDAPVGGDDDFDDIFDF